VGSMTNAGTLGILIPPSIPMIVYAVATEQSVGKLFMAGFAPGILLGCMLIGVSYVVARRKGFRLQARVPWPGRWRALKESGWSLFMPVLILGGIYGVPESVAGYLGIEGGAIFTPTEAAAVAVVYAFLVGAFIHRELTWPDIRRVLLKSAATTSMLMFIIAAAMLFGFILTSEQIPKALADWIIGMHLSPWMFLLVLNLLLILAGDFMEPSSIILILAPIFLPAAVKLGINPIHLGIIFTVNMEVGMITPPVGLNLYVASGITGRGLYEVMWASLPWMLVLVAALAIVTYVPELSLAFPRWLYGTRF
jgi:C4-dicarboxylate transporter DctM subunit